ncbi:DUF2946 domain-containing protein [Pseudomonas sp. DWP3-1-2]|uniref:DUF2946 domain-containing protein n=1 Tax=Pseudomonas sp. DWP3-1-2 TaxID=2804645 RepID=UPI003CF09208
MSQRRTTSVWIACFAVLFSLLVMPLSPNAPPAQSEQVLWGSFCSGSGSRLVAMSLGSVDQDASRHDEHSAMQHCGCCSGSMVVVIPSGFSHGFFAHLKPQRFSPAIVLIHASPRVQWPSANPRASPQV